MPRRPLFPVLAIAPAAEPAPAIGSKKLMYSVDEFCAMNGVSRSTLYAEVQDGKLIARKMRYRVVIFAEDMQAWRDALPRVTVNYAKPAGNKRRAA